LIDLTVTGTMSLIRRVSRRLSGRSKAKAELSTRTPPPIQELVELSDNQPKVTAGLSSSNLFKAVQASSTQATDMDRTLYEIPQPAQVDAMTDLIKDHVPGDNFPYVGVVGSEGESPDARRARMLALKPSYNKRDIPEIKILGCPLISKEGNFSMETLMSYAKVNTDQVPRAKGPMPSGAHSLDYSISKAYVHIKQITILYTPNMSSTTNYCSLWMNLVDNRLVDSDRGSQTNIAVSNQESILEMSCDYCVSVADLRCFTLSYTLERDIVHPGFQWGTASFYFSVTESDLPYQSSKVDAMAVYRMPITTLMSRKTNADTSNISFTPADLVRLRELYKGGDIVDVDEPKRVRAKRSAYSATSIRQVPKGEEIDIQGREGWSFMKGAVKPKVDAFEASVDPDSDDESVPIVEHDLGAAARDREAVLRRYKLEQEKGRDEFILSSNPPSLKDVNPPEEEISAPKPEGEDDELKAFFNGKKKAKQVRLSVSGV